MCEQSDLAEIRKVGEQLSEVVRIIREQLQALTLNVEVEAVGLVSEVVSINQVAKSHRERAKSIFARINSQETARAAAQNAESVLAGAAGPDGEAQTLERLREIVKECLEACSACPYEELQELDKEHHRILGHTRPMLPNMQIFDAFRQRIEHAATALDMIYDALGGVSRAADGRDLVNTRRKLDKIRDEGLRDTFFTEEERQTLAVSMRATFDPREHDRSAVVAGKAIDGSVA